eukprot:315958-Chlamydomonas_euryale.AAC.1
MPLASAPCASPRPHAPRLGPMPLASAPCASPRPHAPRLDPMRLASTPCASPRPHAPRLGPMHLVLCHAEAAVSAMAGNGAGYGRNVFGVSGDEGLGGAIQYVQHTPMSRSSHSRPGVHCRMFQYLAPLMPLL